MLIVNQRALQGQPDIPAAFIGRMSRKKDIGGAGVGSNGKKPRGYA